MRLRFFVTTKRPISSKHTHDASTRTNIAVACLVFEIYESGLSRWCFAKSFSFVGGAKNRHIRYPSWSCSLTLKLSTICTVYVLTRVIASDRQKLSFVRACDRVIFPHFLYFSRECHQLFCRGVFSFFLLDDTFWEKNWSSTFFAKLYWSSTFCSPPILWESVKDLRYASECKLTTIMKTRMVLCKVWLIWAKRIRIKAHQYIEKKNFLIPNW